MSKNPREAYDKGFRDGVRAKNDDRDVISKVIGELFDSSYKEDKDYPESYKEGFERGKKSR
jgi:basic membrane lipoprotein Med (substrate-binding protein (PBP1-ABC) superfamily)